MARYEVVRKVYLTSTGADGPRLFKPGDKVNYDGIPGRALRPIDSAAKEAKAERDPSFVDQAPAKPKGRKGKKAKAKRTDETDKSPPMSPSKAGGNDQTE